MVFFTCSQTGTPSATPEKSMLNTSRRNAIIASTTNSPKRHQLRQGSDQVDARRSLHAAQYQEMDEPQQHRGANDRLPGITIAKQAQFRRVGKETQRRKDDHQIRDVGDHRAQPVSPCGTETHQLTKAFTGVGENAASRGRDGCASAAAWRRPVAGSRHR